MHTDVSPRTRQRGQIAAFLDARTVVISRGKREGVELGDCYVILNNDVGGDWVASLRVFEVKEKMALAKSIWVLPGGPTLSIGWNVFRVDLSGDMQASAKEVSIQTQVEEAVSPPPLREILYKLDRIASEEQCTCVDAPPYDECRKCGAANAVNEAGETLRDAWRELQESD